MMAKNESAIAESTDFTDFLREDYENMADEIEVEFQTLSKEQALRIEVDNELDLALKELELRKSQLPQKQMHSLFDQCSKNAINEVIGHFGLVAIVADSKDGGKSTTPHNFEEGFGLTEAEQKDYEHWKKIKDGHIKVRTIREKHYNAKTSNYRTQQEEKFGGKDAIIKDGYTGKDIAFKNTDTEHIISVSSIENDPKNHLYLTQKERVDMASNEANFTFTDASINRSKNDKNLQEWEQIKRDSGKTNAEHFDIDSNLTNQQSQKAESNVNKTIIPNAVKKHATELADIENVANRGRQTAQYVIGIVMKEFIQQMSVELKILFKEFGNESIKDIFKRFSKALGKIWDKIKPKLKAFYQVHWK